MKRSDRKKRLSDIADVAASLHAAPIEAPDFTSSILDRVDAERAFLAPSVRRRIHISRWAMGASVAMVVLGVALTFRWSPTVSNLAGSPAPISAVVRTVESRADINLDSFRKSIQSAVRTEPATIINSFATLANAVELESPVEPPAPGCCKMAALTPAFTGPVLPLSTAIAMEPCRMQCSAIPQIQSKWRVRPATSDMNAIAAQERIHARAMLDNLSMGAAPAMLDHEADGLPVIR